MKVAGQITEERNEKPNKKASRGGQRQRLWNGIAGGAGAAILGLFFAGNVFTFGIFVAIGVAAGAATNKNVFKEF